MTSGPWAPLPPSPTNNVTQAVTNQEVWAITWPYLSNHTLASFFHGRWALAGRRATAGVATAEPCSVAGSLSLKLRSRAGPTRQLSHAPLSTAGKCWLAKPQEVPGGGPRDRGWGWAQGTGGWGGVPKGPAVPPGSRRQAWGGQALRRSPWGGHTKGQGLETRACLE